MPCTRAVKTAVFTVHGREWAAYTAVIGSRTDHVRGRARPCTQSVHGRERPCTRAVNKAVYRVPDRVGVPCTWPWTHHVHGLARRCIRSVHAVNGGVHGTYNAVHTGRKDGRVHGTRMCMGDGRTMYVARARPCTQSVHGHGRPCTRAVNTAVYRVHDRVGVPCTRPWTHYVHGRCTPVYTVRTRRERPCTRTYTRYVHRLAHGP